MATHRKNMEGKGHDSQDSGAHRSQQQELLLRGCVAGVALDGR